MSLRLAAASDIPSACHLLNEIIEIGGTTAYEDAVDNSEFSSHFLTGENCVSCYVYEDQSGDIAGFQALVKSVDLPVDWVDIATFARVMPKVKGVGTSLFKHTLEFARQSQVNAINARIRADNVSGLSYYSKMGFVEYKTDKAVPLKDGTPVDRIHMRFEIA